MRTLGAKNREQTENPKSEYIRVRVTKSEKQEVNSKATRLNLTESNYLRGIVFEPLKGF
jgi:hypothetical protein